MAVAGNKSLVLGFMTVAKSSGLRGGYLLTSDYGRPLEFHYTSEVRLTGPQVLLHGPDLEEYLYAESIGKPMTDRQTRPPKIILVNEVKLLGLRRLIPAPVVHLYDESSLSQATHLSGEEAADEAGEAPPKVGAVCHADYPQDLAAFDKIRELVPACFDWLEPFDRIHRALAEIKDPDARLVA
jgi:hypothetical protein